MEEFSPKNAIVFDIETQRTFDEVGGRDHFDKLGVSYVGVYSYAQDKMFGFFEQDLATLEKIIITERPSLIGFNSIHFDVPVLQPYFQNIQLSTLPHLDILKEVEKTLGHRLKLDSIAQSTLYQKKSGDGLDAIRWYREGDFESIAKYCLDDVAITRDVYEFGKRHGNLYYQSGGEKKAIPASWGELPTIQERLYEAFKKHEKVNIEYLTVEENAQMKIVSHPIEILEWNDTRFDAYSDTLHTKQRFNVSDVWDMQSSGATFAHQGSLF